MSLPPPPSRDKDITGPAWQKWFSLIKEAVAPIATGGKTLWSTVSKSGSRLTEIETRNHSDLQNLNSDTASHLTGEQLSELTGGGNTNAHKHDHSLQLNLNSTNYTHLTAADHAELTGGIVTALHEHDFDHITFPVANTLGTMSHLYTLSELMDHMWSSGVVDGGALTNNGDGTASIAISIAAIRGSSDPHGTIYGVEAAATANITFTDNSVNYLYLDYAAGTPVWAVTTNSLTPNGLDKVLAYEVHRQGIVLHIIDRRNQTVDASRKINSLFTGFAKFIHAEGGTTLGVSGLYLTVTAGTFFRGVEPITHVAFNTSIAGTANANVFVLWNHVAGVYTATEGSKLISTTTWDNGTNSATLDNNKFGVSWIYIVNNSPSELHVVMGQQQYLKLSDATIATPPSLLPTLIDGMGVLIGFVAYEKGNTIFDGVFSSFAISFTPGLATQHNSLGGLQGGTIGEYYHLTAAQHTDLTDGGLTTLHSHSAIPTSNIISVPATISADTSYIVISYLQVDSNLTINGNLMVIG